MALSQHNVLGLKEATPHEVQGDQILSSSLPQLIEERLFCAEVTTPLVKTLELVYNGLDHCVPAIDAITNKQFIVHMDRDQQYAIQQLHCNDAQCKGISVPTTQCAAHELPNPQVAAQGT